ncbi:MAG: SMP-30/gluconolactonase/LRE family protein [Planctomycetota bacterium]|nr:SMP-30/gluconolactonase/LRE family protein [Planctomycetota bacterium]
MSRSRIFGVWVVLAVCQGGHGMVRAVWAEELYVATPLTPVGEFTSGVEGPSCDRDGNVFAVNFKEQQTIGRVTPDGQGEVFVTLPGKSTGNGIVFDQQGYFYVADYAEHNVLRVDPKTKQIDVFCKVPTTDQPNDLAIAGNGTMYASDPNWGEGHGRVWMVSTAGVAKQVAGDLGTSNGIEVSPDGKWLYVNESVQRNVWKFPIRDDGTLGDKELIKQFPDHGFDGMRCDTQGNLYITRHGKGTVVIMTPFGTELREIDVLGHQPTNLCFGGPDGRTVYVTEAENTRLVQFRVAIAGASWQRWRDR